ncbi:MAG: methyltransferase domain-containing protein [Actinomycetota bacterium]
MKGYGPHSYGDGFADVYDDWYPDVTDVEGTVAFVAALAPGGRVVELGIGTGRIALPLLEAGLAVSGVDASGPMLARLADKPRADELTVVEGDMSETLPPGRFDVALATYNTFFNLTEPGAQERCLALVFDALRPGGRLVLETFVADDDPDGATAGVSPRTIEADRVVLTVSRRDPAEQVVDGQMVELSAGGIRMRPWSIRYRTPPQLDQLTAVAGFELEARWSDWRGAVFDPDGPHQVVVYRRPSRQTGAHPPESDVR